MSVLSAHAIAHAIHNKIFTAQDIAEHTRAWIAQQDPTIDAWAHWDHAQTSRHTEQYPKGTLAGVPIGIKDIIDTCDYPTTWGSAFHTNRRPKQDAFLIAALRKAGAQIIGKTVTTEFAYLAPSPTKNPHHPQYSPGGSSSGSAAAVAAGMVPLAIGTQTNGSMIRPGSYCGVLAFKPSHGSISRTGVLLQSWPLDTIGIYARNLTDIALCTDVIMAYDANDDAMQETVPCALGEALQRIDKNNKPKIAMVKTPVWERASADTKTIFARAQAKLGAQTLALPSIFDHAFDAHFTLMMRDMARGFAAYDKRDGLSPEMQTMMDIGKEIEDDRYDQARFQRASCQEELAAIFSEFDAILTPSACAEAPRGFATTGDPCFCTIWSLAGVPSINLPVGLGGNNLPIGLQLVGAYEQEAKLLQSADWVLQQFPQHIRT
ncbi:MAG: amidase [Pseudomonadota bacterium]